jgi:MoxR-like ATPase
MINDDDPTQSLPDNDKTTQPTLEAILDRMQGFEGRIFQHLQGMESRFESQIASLREELTSQTASLRDELTSQTASLRDELTSQIATLREEMNSGFRLVANKIDVLNEDSLSLRASQRELLKRMGELESRAS